MDGSSVLRLNIGAGKQDLPGFTSVDRKSGQEAYPLSYDDNSAEEIRASHVLEHFSHREIENVLRDWVRVLKPGGIIRLAVPDFGLLAAAYLEGEPINPQPYIMGGHIDGDDHHGAIFDTESLAELMVRCGLTRVQKWESDQSDCASLPISLNLMGVKPYGDPEIVKLEGVTAVMSVPRFAPTLTARCAFTAISDCRIRMQMIQGCFWHKQICQVMEDEAKREGCRYVLTLDYDSVFRTSDVLELYRLMEAREDLDAVAAVQAKRGDDGKVLLSPRDGRPGYVWQHQHQAVTLVDTAHFGLTIFRAEKLLSLPHPWMEPKANPETGRWDDHCIDPDITFWHKWRENGNTLAVANTVRIGHMEERIAWCDKDFKVRYQTINEFTSSGAPDYIY